MTAGQSEKQRQEREVFDRFAARVTLDVVPGSVVSRDSPDIVCDLVGEGQVGFELVRLADTQFMRTMGESERRGELLRNYGSLVSAELRQAFDAAYRDSDINFSFVIGTTRRQVQDVLPHLLEDLIQRGAAWHGMWVYGPAFRGIVGSVRVARIRGFTEGPILLTSAAEWYGNPVNDTLQAKFAKSYPVSYPLELLAYFGLQPPPTELWDMDFSPIDTARAASQFRRVWIYDTWGGRFIAIPAVMNALHRGLCEVSTEVR